MKYIKNVAVAITLASGMMFSQQPAAQNPDPAGRAGQDKPQADKPAVQVDKPAAQADRPSATSDSANTRTFTGTIVNASCSQASNLTSSGSYAADRNTSSSTTTKTSTTTAPADPGASTKSTTESSTTMSKNPPKSVYDKQRDVMKQCAANNSTTTFAVLTDDGSFYKLDETGNSQVTSQAASGDKGKKNVKNMRVTVTGTVQGDSIKVQSLAKTDKPFAPA
jgi:hypothetical protein